MSDTVMVGRKAARGNCGYAVGESVENGHTAPIQKGEEQKCQPRIDDKTGLSDRTELGQEIAFVQVLFARGENVQRAPGNLWQEAHENYDDGNTTTPLQEATPKEQAARQHADIIQQRRSRGRKSGHAFEESLHRIKSSLINKGKRT